MDLICNEFTLAYNVKIISRGLYKQGQGIFGKVMFDLWITWLKPLHVQRNCLAGGADKAMQRDAPHCLQMVFVFSLGTERKSGFLNVKEAKDVVHLYFLSTCCC